MTKLRALGPWLVLGLAVPAWLAADTIRLPFSLGPNAVDRWAPRGRAAAGHAILRAADGSRAPSALALVRTYAAPGSGSTLTSISSVPATRPLLRAQVCAESGAATTVLALSNPGDEEVTVALDLHDASGGPATGVAPEELVLPPRGQVARFLGEIFASVPPGFSGSVVVRAAAPIGLSSLRASVNARGEFLLASVPVADLDRGALEGLRVVPHVVEGEGYVTELTLLNPAKTTLAGIVAFYTSSGAPLDLRVEGEFRSTLSYTIPPSGVRR